MMFPKKVSCECPIIYSTTENATHFFGFHDLCPWDDKDRCLLVHRVKDKELMRVPTNQDVAEVCLWDTKTGDIEAFGETTAWNWPQGARLQWMPNANKTVVYNMLLDRKIVGIVKDLMTGAERVLPFSCYTISPSGRYILSPNFGRLHLYYQAYGYDGIGTGSERDLLPEDDGIFRIDLETERTELILSISEIAECARCQAGPGVPFFVTHPTFNPSGTRFCFFLRFFPQDNVSYSIFMVADINGDNLSVVAEEKVSHFDWYDDDTLLVWTRYLPKSVAASRRKGLLSWPAMKPIIDLARNLRPNVKQALWREAYYRISLGCVDNHKPVGMGLLEQDGHPMFSRDRKWVLTDTYADPKDRHRSLILFDYEKEIRYDIGRLYSPPTFPDRGGINCDLHPRWNHAGTQVCVDSTHTGVRQMHIIDVSDVVVNECE